MDLRPAKQVVDVFRLHGQPLGFARGDLASDLAAEFADLPLELPHARFARVAGDHFLQRLLGNRELLGGQPVFLQLPRYQVTLGDLELLTFGIPGEVHRLHAIEQRPGDRLHEVRGRNEQHFREVERHAEVVVGERVVLSGIEHFEQR